MRKWLTGLLFLAIILPVGCGRFGSKYHKEKLTAYHLKDGKWVAKHHRHEKKHTKDASGQDIDVDIDTESWAYLVYADHGHATVNYYTGALSPDVLPSHTTWADSGTVISTPTGVVTIDSPTAAAIADASIDPGSVVVETMSVDESGNTAADNGDAGDGSSGAADDGGGGDGGSGGDSGGGDSGGDSGGGGGDGGGDGGGGE